MSYLWMLICYFWKGGKNSNAVVMPRTQTNYFIQIIQKIEEKGAAKKSKKKKKRKENGA